MALIWKVTISVTAYQQHTHRSSNQLHRALLLEVSIHTFDVYLLHYYETASFTIAFAPAANFPLLATAYLGMLTGG